MWALVVYLTIYGAPPVYFDSEAKCIRLMDTVQRHTSPDKIIFMVCEKVRDKYESASRPARTTMQ